MDSAAGRGRKINVLLIEDKIADASLVLRVLGGSQNPGFNVHVVAELWRALEYLGSKHPNIILLDLGLPDSQGVDTLKKVSAAAAGIPIIVLTVTDIPQAVLDAIKSGARDYIVKSRLRRQDLMDSILRHPGVEVSLRPEIGGRTPHAEVSVLVVEDNPADLTLIRRMLASQFVLRFEIIPATRLSDAIRQLRYGADVVLLDLNLPDSQGLDTLRAIRGNNAEIPVVILSGTGDQERALEALQNGAQDYLVKGHVDAHLLTRAIARHVSRLKADQLRNREEA